ncbi:MAG: hypothetical protein AAGA77_15875 [Bacteroidota bacterium]
MKNILAIFLLFLSCGLMAQNSSFGMGVHAINLENDQGLYFTGDVRVQFTERFGWQSQVGYMSFNDKETISSEQIPPPSSGTTLVVISNERRVTALTAKTSLTTKIFSMDGFTAEALVGGGGFSQGGTIYGLFSGELFLSARIGKNTIAGIPISYNYITSEREDFYSVGVSLRYHM